MRLRSSWTCVVPEARSNTQKGYLVKWKGDIPNSWDQKTTVQIDPKESIIFNDNNGTGNIRNSGLSLGIDKPLNQIGINLKHTCMYRRISFQSQSCMSTYCWNCSDTYTQCSLGNRIQKRWIMTLPNPFVFIWQSINKIKNCFLIVLGMMHHVIWHSLYLSFSRI